MIFFKRGLYCICLFLIGCANEPEDQIKHFVQSQTVSDLQGVVLRERPSFEPVPYRVSNLRSPFKIAPFSGVSAASRARAKTPLEFIPLENFTMVGAFGRLGTYWGVVEDDAGRTHRVAIGDYIGQKAGVIQKITERSIEVKELIADGQQGWQERLITINMLE